MLIKTSSQTFFHEKKLIQIWKAFRNFIIPPRNQGRRERRRSRVPRAGGKGGGRGQFDENKITELS